MAVSFSIIGQGSDQAWLRSLSPFSFGEENLLFLYPFRFNLPVRLA